MQGTLMYDVEVTVDSQIQLDDLKTRIQGLIKTLPEVTGDVELVDTAGFSDDSFNND